MEPSEYDDVQMALAQKVTAIYHSYDQINEWSSKMGSPKPSKRARRS